MTKFPLLSPWILGTVDPIHQVFLVRINLGLLRVIKRPAKNNRLWRKAHSNDGAVFPN